MILANGVLRPTEEQNTLLEGLGAEISQVLRRPPPPAEVVIAACDALAGRLLAGEFDGLLASLGLEERFTREQVRSAAALMRRDSLEYKLELELGRDFTAPRRLEPPHARLSFTRQVLPLGVLFHIAAGNVDGLPAYSVVEGLLTGNVNLLKLPQADQGLSVLLLKALVDQAPELAPYVWVFDTPSDDLPAMKRMAELSDGIVVWGGDGAVSAVRRFAPPGVKLIEWGHRLSFAYLSGEQDRERDWPALARHIIDTQQLLCSSC